MSAQPSFAVQLLIAEMRRLREEKALLQKKVVLLVGALEDAAEALDNYSDVRDGSYGEPAPNRAMQAITEIDSVVWRLRT